MKALVVGLIELPRPDPGGGGNGEEQRQRPCRPAAVEVRGQVARVAHSVLYQPTPTPSRLSYHGTFALPPGRCHLPLFILLDGQCRVCYGTVLRQRSANTPPLTLHSLAIMTLALLQVRVLLIDLNPGSSINACLASCIRWGPP